MLKSWAPQRTVSPVSCFGPKTCHNRLFLQSQVYVELCENVEEQLAT